VSTSPSPFVVLSTSCHLLYLHSFPTRRSSDLIYKRITEANKHLICIADNIDTRDKNAKLLYQFMSLVAELEKDMIKFRTTTGMEKNFEKGNFNGGKVYGYNTENKELKLNEKEAKVVRYIFE